MTRNTPVPAPAYPRPLDALELAVLDWLAETGCGRGVLDCPDGMDFYAAAATRRALVRLGYAALDCPPGGPGVYLPTAAGEALLARLAAERKRPRADRGRSRID